MNFHKGVQLGLYSNDSIIKNLSPKSELQKNKIKQFLLMLMGGNNEIFITIEICEQTFGGTYTVNHLEVRKRKDHQSSDISA